MGVPELSDALRRVPCSGCGLSKRYILNKEAFDRGFDVVAMGHNLDDEAATLMGNVLHWEVGSLARQQPALPSTRDTLIKRVKPLYTMTEREVAANAILRGIDYVEEECPNSVGARSIVYKNALDDIEAKSPGTKHGFVSTFLDPHPPGHGDLPGGLRPAGMHHLRPSHHRRGLRLLPDVAAGPRQKAALRTEK